MKRHIREYGAGYKVCQQHKSSTLAPGGLLQPLSIPERVWDDISMDFIEGLPKSGVVDTILVVVDRLSKYAHFLGLRHPFTIHSVAALFVKEIIRLHGFSRSIVSVRDKVFTFWEVLLWLQGTVLRRSSTYHPQTDGQTKVLNRCLEIYLRCFANEKPKQWSSWFISFSSQHYAFQGVVWEGSASIALL